MHRDAEHFVRSDTDQKDDDHIYFADIRDLHRQYHNIPSVHLGQLHRWTVLAQGHDSNSYHLASSVSVQESDGKVRPYSGTEDHARGRARVIHG